MNGVAALWLSFLDSLLVEAVGWSAGILAVFFSVVRYYRKPVENYLTNLEQKMAELLRERLTPDQQDDIQEPLLEIIKKWGRLVHREYYYYIALKKSLQLAAASAFFWTGAYVVRFLGITGEFDWLPEQVLTIYMKTRPIIVTSQQASVLSPYVVLKVLSTFCVFSAAFLSLTVVLKFGFTPGEADPDPLAPFNE